MRVSGVLETPNYRQNDERAKKGNTGGGEIDGSERRKHLTSREVERLLEATKGTRNEIRNRCLLLVMFRHGLRVSEACGLKLDQVDMESRVLHVRRLKAGLSTTQPLRDDELRAVKAWLKERARVTTLTAAPERAKKVQPTFSEGKGHDPRHCRRRFRVARNVSVSGHRPSRPNACANWLTLIK